MMPAILYEKTQGKLNGPVASILVVKIQALRQSWPARKTDVQADLYQAPALS